MKLKCKKTVQLGDNKTPQPFTANKIYDASKIPGGSDVFVTGDVMRKCGQLEWQAITAWPDGYVIVGVATFEVME